MYVGGGVRVCKVNGYYSATIAHQETIPHGSVYTQISYPSPPPLPPKPSNPKSIEMPVPGKLFLNIYKNIVMSFFLFTLRTS